MRMDNSQYLQKISQCLYNIIKIIDAHNTSPVEIDKKLDKFYSEEKDKLIKLLEKNAGLLKIKELNESLIQNLLFSTGKTEISRKQTDKAYDYLSESLAKIQAERKSDSFEPTTGLENSPLKKYLQDFLNRKKINNKEKIELVYLGIRGICLNSNKKNCYSPKDNTNRFNYLKIIITKSGKSITAKELNKKAKTKWTINSPIVISQEISSINKTIKEKLSIKNDVILSDNGYKLNTIDYELITS